jgi:hypothetical protein
MTAMNLQPNYNVMPPAKVLGGVPNMEAGNDISRIVEDAAGLGFGVLVVQGTSDQGVAKASALNATVGAVAALGTGNSTGNGTFSAPTIAAGAKAGAWTIAFIDATHFVVSDPDGHEVGKGTAGAAYAGTGPNFTFTAGGTPQAAGDLFQATVSQVSAKIIGISKRDTTLAPSTSAQDVYPQTATAAIRNKGPITVMAGGTVAAHDPVYYIPATNKYTNVPGTSNVLVPGAAFDGSSTDGNLVDVRLNLA